MAKSIKPKKEIIKYYRVFCEEGFFCGFEKGGKLRFSIDPKEAKEFEEIEKFNTLKRLYKGEMLIEYV